MLIKSKSFAFFVAVLTVSACLASDVHGQRGGDRGDRGGDRGDRGDRGREDRRNRDRSSDQTERYMGYIQGMDRNKNGLVEPSEMSGRGQQWVQGMGFDTSRPIRLKDIESKIRRNERDRLRGRAKEESDKNFSNSVPNFSSVEIEREPIQGFGFDMPNLVENEDTSRYQNKYSDDVTRQADDILRRYDRNKNGALDADEVRTARWGNPPASESDTNKDGRLSRAELMERYKLREGNGRGSSSRSPSSSGRNYRSRDRRSSSSDRRSLGSGGSYGSSGSRSGYRSSGGSSSSSSGRSSSSGNDSERLRSYVNNQIDQYDEDKDGKLSKTELEKMSRPPRNADADKDGFLDKDEMFAFYNGDEKPKSSSSSKSKTPSTRGGSSGSRGLSSGDLSRKLRDNSQIAMGDFTDEWTDEAFEEFNRLDLNGDGYITREEHATATKSASKGSGGSSGSSTRTKSYRSGNSSYSRGGSSRGSTNRSSRWSRDK